MFDDALKHISVGIDNINEAAIVLGVEVDYNPSAELKKELISTGRKGVRFQLMLSEAIEK